MDGLAIHATPRSATKSRHRLELHNTQIDQTAAAKHCCGTTHLPTGRVCMLPERHSGGCQFTDRPAD